MTTNNHEVIFVIVNAGFAEVAMDVAREQCVRGGTILNARGVAREKEAAFFGITIQQEKEILMKVVEKEIKDKVLNALYSQMGMAKHAKGIAFDSGGVASGPMTSGFILPFAVGACVALQGSEAVLRDAFGVVALVAMAPLFTFQLLGFRAIIGRKMAEHRAMRRILDADDQQIINFM